MRIVIATIYQAIRGGAEKYLQALVQEMARRGHQVAVVYEHTAGEREGKFHSDDITAKEVSEQLWNEWKPDVVYLNGLENVSWEAELLTKYPCVLYAHNYQGTCATGTKSHMWPQPMPCERLFGPACLVVNYLRRCGGLNPLKLWEQYQLQKKRLELLSRYRSVLVASEHMRNEFLRHDVCPSDSLHCLPYPLTDSSPDVQPPTWREFSDVVFMAARLTKLKGGQFLIPAMEMAQRELGRKLKLVVAGNGPQRSEWQELAERKGISTEFLGWISGEERNQWMRRADLLAVPSVWPEPFGLTGIEAGCVGLPAVAYAVGGIPDWLQSGESGELAPGNPPTVEGLALAIAKALHNPHHWQKLRTGAWKMSQRFAMATHMDQLEAVFERAIQGK